ncbi:MAG: hypothetical protein AB1671_11395, partial [Thermodesulfobacteriota bacterium]
MGRGRGTGEGRRQIGASTLVAWLWVCGVWIQPCYAGLFGEYWSRFDRYLATFDPAGRLVRQPIEKQIPALTFKGFYRQWADILLTGDQQVG